MKSPYGIDEDQAQGIRTKILDQLNREEVVNAIKKNLDEHCQRAIDKTTEHLSDEYALVIEEIVKERAKRLVQELLKGNRDVAVFFNLAARPMQYGPDKGKPFVYDPDGIRAAIFGTFKDEIRDAELISLKEENSRLRDSIRLDREMRNRY